jgi:hypothetical protein
MMDRNNKKELFKIANDDNRKEGKYVIGYENE